MFSYYFLFSEVSQPLCNMLRLFSSFPTQTIFFSSLTHSVNLYFLSGTILSLIKSLKLLPHLVIGCLFLPLEFGLSFAGIHSPFVALHLFSLSFEFLFQENCFAGLFR
jgi:hypothetical protein